LRCATRWRAAYVGEVMANDSVGGTDKPGLSVANKARPIRRTTDNRSPGAPGSMSPPSRPKSGDFGYGGIPTARLKTCACTALQRGKKPAKNPRQSSRFLVKNAIIRASDWANFAPLVRVASGRSQRDRRRLHYTSDRRSLPR
jgi:hypothetical protein